MSTPKVSIIVPIYKVEKYLIRCLDSIINQTLKELEIILVDDGSPDACPSICNEYSNKDKRIKIIHKKNEGLGFARNSGLEIAVGEYIAFVDSDDFVSITMYEKLYNLAVLNKLDAIYCGFNLIRKSGEIKSFNQVEDFKVFDGRFEVDPFLFEMIGSNPSYHSDMRYLMSSCLSLYSNKIISKYNIKFHSEREFISEDLLFNMDFLINVKRIGLASDIFYNYCYNGESLTKTYNVNRFKEQKKLYCEIERKMKIHYDYNLFKNNLDRLKISHLRGSIFQEIKNISLKNFHKRWSNIILMCNDNIFEEIFLNFPFKKLPIKHRLFFLCLKYRLTLFLILFVIIDSKIKQ